MPEARYKPLVDRLAADIRAGRLAPGARLPTHRKLAAREGLALATASRVYAELQAMGLVSGETGRGSFVREIALPRGQGVDQLAVAADMVDLGFNYPSVAGQSDLLRAALRSLAAAGDLDSLLHYQPHGGRPPDRDLVAMHLATQGLDVAPGQVMLVDGAQHGLATTAMALLKPGDVVAVDALSYPGFRVLAQAQGLELLPIPAAGVGPDLEALRLACRRRRVRAIYMMPTLHNPLGWVMSASRRRRLVAIARRHDLLIIEDSVYAFLADQAPPPLASLAPERTVHVSGLSKSVATGLRIGYLAAPPEHVPAIERAIRATTWSTPGVTTAIACRWLADGTVTRLEAAKRRDAAERQAIASAVLKPLRLVAHPASYFAWLPLGEDARADRVAMRLMRQRISVSTAEPFSTAKVVPQAIRLALGSVSLERLREALGVVKGATEAESA